MIKGSGEMIMDATPASRFWHNPPPRPMQMQITKAYKNAHKCWQQEQRMHPKHQAALYNTRKKLKYQSITYARRYRGAQAVYCDSCSILKFALFKRLSFA
eukprot:GHVT01023734.1.p3 GENE.GHVT01023734.1~~GHVT01023734.1.p3  ORF type:complete len:100 (-),score=2.26 GHVT01023734.1:731-1030(-)